MKLLQVVKDDGEEIPEKYVLIAESEYEKYQNQVLVPPKLNLKQVSRWLHKEPKWIIQNILDIPRYRRKLDINHGGCVYYSQGSGQSYEIEPTAFADFIRLNFADIWKNATPIKK